MRVFKTGTTLKSGYPHGKNDRPPPFPRLTSQYVHHHLYRRAAVRRVHPHPLQQQRQHGPQAHAREDDHGQRGRDRQRLGEGRAERRRADEAGDGEYRGERERHAQLAGEEARLGLGIEGAQGFRTARGARGGVVLGVR